MGHYRIHAVTLQGVLMGYLWDTKPIIFNNDPEMGHYILLSLLSQNG